MKYATFTEKELFKTSHDADRNYLEYDSLLITHPEYEDNLRNLWSMLIIIRWLFGFAININSAFRSQRVNLAVNGAVNSQHLTASAADITPVDTTKYIALRDLLLNAVKSGRLQVGQLIIYNQRRFIHISLQNGNKKNEILYK